MTKVERGTYFYQARLDYAYVAYIVRGEVDTLKGYTRYWASQRQQRIIVWG